MVVIGPRCAADRRLSAVFTSEICTHNLAAAASFPTQIPSSWLSQTGIGQIKWLGGRTSTQESARPLHKQKDVVE